MLVRRLRLVLLAPVLPMVGCSLDSVVSIEAETSANTCEDDDECPGARCDDGICRATGTLETLLIEVTPPLGKDTSTSLSFLKQLQGLIPAGGAQDIDVGVPVRVTGRIHADAARTDECSFTDADGEEAKVGADGTIPARVLFRQLARLPGLFASDYVAETRFHRGEAAPLFHLTLPPGTYDIHVQPFRQRAPGCEIAPTVYRARAVRSNAGKVDLNLNLSPPAKLELGIAWPERGWESPPRGWTADMLHPETGMTLAPRITLPDATATATGDWESNATLVYSTAEVLNSTSRGFIRLEPPAGETAPKLVVARETLSIFGGKGLIKHFKDLPAVSRVEGHVTDELARPVERAHVALTAMSLDGVVDTWASYTQHLETDAEGRFSVEIFGGTYRVHVVPPAGLGLAQEVRMGVELGQPRVVDIELRKTLEPDGAVLTPRGDPFFGATVHATPLPVPTDIIDQALDRANVAPSATTGQVRNGVVSGFLVDPGLFNVSVRPAEDSGYPWIVIQNFDSTGDLGQVSMSYPVVYRGRIMSGGAPLEGALIRAYVYTASGKPVDADEASTLLLVAETRSGARGDYQLLLPSSLRQAEGD